MELGVQVRIYRSPDDGSQQQTFGGRRGGLPVEYVIQAKNLDDLKRVLPRFMDEVNKVRYSRGRFDLNSNPN